MRIHHLNCGTMCPPGRRFMDGNPHLDGPAQLVCHCLLVEADDRLVLVDTGFGLRDVGTPLPRLSRVFVGLLRPRLDPEETAIRQIERLGFNPHDVRDIVLTHLDFDHAGGIEDFPGARVHCLADEHEAATQRKGPVARGRYRPRQWDEEVPFRLYRAPRGEPWFGFQSVRSLDGLPDDLLLVPLIGHTWGHAAVAVRRNEGSWMLLAGDAYFHREELAEPPSCPPGLRAYQTLMEVDRQHRLENQARLRELQRAHPEVTIASSHDREELAALAAKGVPERAPGAVGAAVHGG